MSISGAQIVAVAAWLSVLAAPWYVLAAGVTPRAAAGVFGVSLLVGIGAGAYHAGAVLRRQRMVAAAAEEMARRAGEERARRNL